MKICPLKFHQGRPDGMCNPHCIMFNDETEDCLLAEALLVYTQTHCFPPKPAAVTYPNSNTGKDSHSEYWDNSIYSWEKDDSVLSSNREYRKNLKEEGF